MILPFYVMALYGGARSVKALWPVLLVSGVSFATGQFVASNFLDYALTDVLSSLSGLIVTLLFLRVWRPKAAPEFAIAAHVTGAARRETDSGVAGLVPGSWCRSSSSPGRTSRCS